MKRADDLRSKRTSVIVQSEHVLEQLSSKGGSRKGLALGEVEKPGISSLLNYPYSGGGTGEQTSSREKKILTSKLAGRQVQVNQGGRNQVAASANTQVDASRS